MASSRNYITSNDLSPDAFLCSGGKIITKSKPTEIEVIDTNTVDLEISGDEGNFTLSADTIIDPISSNMLSSSNNGLVVDLCHILETLNSLPLNCSNLSSISAVSAAPPPSAVPIVGGLVILEDFGPDTQFSGDVGVSWTNLVSPGDAPMSPNCFFLGADTVEYVANEGLLFVPHNNTHVIMDTVSCSTPGPDEGIYLHVSTDGGVTYTGSYFVDPGFPDALGYQLHFEPTYNNAPMSSTPISSASFDKYMIITTEDRSGTPTDLIFYSKDYGVTWNALDTGIVAPNTPQIVGFVPSQLDGYVALYDDGQIYYTANFEVPSYTYGGAVSVGGSIIGETMNDIIYAWDEPNLTGHLLVSTNNNNYYSSIQGANFPTWQEKTLPSSIFKFLYDNRFYGVVGVAVNGFYYGPMFDWHFSSPNFYTIPGMTTIRDITWRDDLSVWVAVGESGGSQVVATIPESIVNPSGWTIQTSAPPVGNFTQIA